MLLLILLTKINFGTSQRDFSTRSINIHRCFILNIPPPERISGGGIFNYFFTFSLVNHSRRSEKKRGQREKGSNSEWGGRKRCQTAPYAES